MEFKELIKQSYYYDVTGMFFLGNCMAWLKLFPSESIDLINTDHPYKTISGGNSSELSKRHDTSILSKNDGKIFEHNEIDCKEWFPEFYRVLKDKTHCYVMTNLFNLDYFIQQSEKVGFKLHNLLIWKKQNSTPNRWYMKNQEYILFLRKGKAKPINNMGSKTVHCFENPFGNKLHPTEKPVSLMEFYITNSSNKNDIVLDPFVGAGASALASKKNNRRWIAIEKDKKYLDVAVERIKIYE